MRYYSNTAVTTSLTSGVSASATTLAVGLTSGFPTSYPWTAVLDEGAGSEELVQVTNVAGLTLTVLRGQDGTAGAIHSAGAAFKHVASARDYREPQEHMAASFGVHGVLGFVLGSYDVQDVTNKDLSSSTNTFPATLATLAGAQSLSNKTLVQPVIADLTNAQHDHSAANKGGNIP